MTRRGFSAAHQDAAALEASRRMIARGERPAYRLRTGQDGRWQVAEAPWLSVAAVDRREVIQAATRTIAAWLDCDSEAFDVDIA